MIRVACVLVCLLISPTFALADDASRAQPRKPASGVVEKLARRIEPNLKGDPERLTQYIEFFRNEIGNDFRLFAFDVKAKVVRGSQRRAGSGDPRTTDPRTTHPQVELRGHIEFPETRASLVQYLELLGFTVEDRLNKIPSEQLGDKNFGFVKTSHSLSYDKPSGERSVETDCLLAEPLYLLREDGDHLLVHTGEGYLAYVKSADVLRVDGETFARYLDGPVVRLKSDHQADDLLIPAGARLKWVNTLSNTAGVTAELPTGEHVVLPVTSCEVHYEPADQLEAIVANAKQLLGTSYLWGGRTKAGCDCSGLVQIAYATAGLNLPRDSYQQFYVGRLTGTRWHTAGLRRGDTLYFLGEDGKIRHTGMYLGDDHFIHAVSPVVRINSFNPEDKDYDARRHASFAFAKRLLD